MKYILTILSTLWVAGLGIAIWDHFSNPVSALVVMGIALPLLWGLASI